MPEIRFPGLATGIDTTAIVQQLLEIESRRLKAKQEDLANENIKGETIGELDSKLNAFRTAIRTISDSDQLRSFDSVSSDTDIMTALANSNAAEGNHTIQIGQLATTDRWVHDGLKYATSYVKDSAENGVFIVSYNHQEMMIQTTDTTSLEDLAAFINNSADNPGIVASVLKYDAGSDQVYHLVLSGQDSGSDYQVTINDSNTEVWNADSLLESNGENATLTTKIKDIDTFSGEIESGSTPDQIRITGNQHDGTAVDYYFDVTQYTTVEELLAEIEEAFSDTATATVSNGEIKLTDNTCGTSSMSLTLTFIPGTDSTASLTLPTFTETTVGGSTSAGLADLTAGTFTQTQSAQDSMIRVDGYPASTDTAEVQILTSSENAGSGSYTLTFMGETTNSIAYDADLSTVEVELNALSTIVAVGGVTVGGTGPTDSNNPMTITFSDTAGDVNQITIAESMNGDHTMSPQTEGDSNWIRRSTNTIDDVLAGVTLNLHDTTYNTVTQTYDSVKVTLTRDTEALKEKMTAMIEAYNEVVTFLQEQADYDPETKTAPILYGDYSITTIRSQLKNPFILAASGFTTDDSFTMPKDIGLTINSDGLLELDSNEFDEAITDDYLAVLELIGAMKTGTSAGADAAYIKFYDAGNNTTAGAYNVKVTVNAGEITEAKIWTVDEEEADARTVDAENIEGNTVTCNSEFDDNGNPLYPENSLTFTVDLNQSGTLEATIYVKQGFAGTTKDALDDMLAYNGRVAISQKRIADYTDRLNEQIVTEQARLERYEDRLVLRFARLEKTLQMINQQMAGLNMIQ